MLNLNHKTCMFISDVLEGGVGPSMEFYTTPEIEREREHIAHLYKKNREEHPGWCFQDCARDAKATWLNAYIQGVTRREGLNDEKL